MKKSIRELAVDPKQYDGSEILWGSEGHGLSHIRRLFLERLTPFLGNVAGKSVLDLGCGQGWLSNELLQRGAIVTGVDPSSKNIQSARKQYPEVHFVQGELQTFPGVDEYDLITAIMVFEHFPNLEDAYERVRKLVKHGGSLLMITGDFKKFTTPRFGYTVETEELGSGEVATRTDYGERAGVIYDINRTADRFIEAAGNTGFNISAHQPISAPKWLIDEQPRYAVQNGEPLFHLFEFRSED